MKKNVKDYAIYFFTLILGVAIFYIFNAMDAQEALLKVSESKQEIMGLMNTMLGGISVFVSFILGFLIIYASRFLMKRRKKEFGIYMTLGMGKGQISKILLLETLLIGLISLVVGLVCGIFISQVMSTFVAKLFEVDMTQYEFVFSSAALVKTIVYFGIMYLMVMIFNTFSVSKCKLIDLINAKKQSEKVKVKNPVISVLVFLIAVFILGTAYYTVVDKALTMKEETLYLAIGMGVIGTYLVFWSLSGFILKVVQASKKIYLKNLNTFVLRQLHSEVNTTVFSMTVICLLLFLTIGILSSAVSINNSVKGDLKENAPVDVMLVESRNLTPTETITEAEVQKSKLSIDTILDQYQFDQSVLKDKIEVNAYEVPDFTLRETQKSNIEEVTKNFKFIQLDTKESIMKLSDYNQVAKLYNLPTYELKDNEYIVIANFDSMVELRDQSLKQKPDININGQTYHAKYDKCQDGFIQISNSHTNTGIYLVPDDAVTEDQLVYSYLIANYQANTDAEKQAIEKQMETLDVKLRPQIMMESKISIYDSAVGLGAIVTFIGLYLGIIFLISSAAMLALKELSESSDNKERYTVLRKIGVDERMINRSLFAQIGIFFLLPLTLAIIHSIFGIQFANKILMTVINKDLLLPIVITSVVIAFIYGGYFLITYLCSKKIISES